MMCPDCKEATEHPSHRQYCPKCIYCGARLIKRIGALLSGDRVIKQQRMRKVLDDWVAYGHKESEIRDLIKQETLIQPQAKKGQR